MANVRTVAHRIFNRTKPVFRIVAGSSIVMANRLWNARYGGAPSAGPPPPSPTPPPTPPPPPGPTNALTTQAGDFLMTQAGDNLVFA